MRIRRIALLVIATLLLSVALGEDCRVAEGNVNHFATLLAYLARAYEQPSEENEAAIVSRLEYIRAVSETDYALARSIYEHWKRVYLDPDYTLYLYDGGERATALEEAGLRDSAAHAIVVLGYELKDGEMTDELKGRCDAAAAVARSFPSAILVCSGGPTGGNNPLNHTEAGMMREYLTTTCGIDPERIHIDEQAMTTVDNANNTYRILQENGIETMTIVTSSYHQRWGQAVYNAVDALYRQQHGYFVEIVGNYSYDIAPSRSRYRQDDRVAARQIAAVLNLPKQVTDKLKEVLPVD